MQEQRTFMHTQNEQQRTNNHRISHLGVISSHDIHLYTFLASKSLEK